MKVDANSVEEYLDKVPEERKAVFAQLRATVLENLPQGYEECLNYGMIGYVVPHSIYPSGYHCDPKLPLPFMNIASQKNFIGFYHMGIYSKKELLDWFVEEYNQLGFNKLDMGKSCIRFKKMDQIPFELLGELVKKITVEDWISFYEASVKR